MRNTKSPNSARRVEKLRVSSAGGDALRIARWLRRAHHRGSNPPQPCETRCMARWLVFLLCAGLLRAQQPETLLYDVESSILSRDLADCLRCSRTARRQCAGPAARVADAGFGADRKPGADMAAADVGIRLCSTSCHSAIGGRTTRPDVALMTARLAQVNRGSVISALRGSTVRIAAAGGTAGPSSSAYFYFFAASVDARLLGNPELLVLGRPFWRGNAGSTEYWFTLARPDLLIVANNRDLLAAVLGRVLNGSSTRALPAALPEWSEVDQRERRCGGSRHFASSPEGSGIALSLGATQKLELRCLCTSRPVAPQADFSDLAAAKGSVGARDRTQLPLETTSLSFAFGLLGLGEIQMIRRGIAALLCVLVTQERQALRSRRSKRRICSPWRRIAIRN